MRILFTHSYFLHLDNKQLKTHTPFAPLATLYAASLLRENNFDVKLADLQFSLSPGEIEAQITGYKPDVLVIYDDAFNYLTKMCLTNMREAAFSMQQIAKKHGIRVIVSSSDATDHLEKYFDNGADFIIIGEGERTLLELLTAAQKNPEFDPASINGLAFAQNGSIRKSPPRQVIRDLDELPPPAWDLVDLQPYKDTWIKYQGFFSVNFVTTRGCPYKCNWCAKPVYGNRYNSHSPAEIVSQIKKLQQKWGFSNVWFADDIFGLKPGWIAEFSKQVKDQRLSITFKIQSRADLLLEAENIRNLAEAGCTEVWMGAESGSQKILDAMEKGTSIAQIKEATSLLKQFGIRPCFFLQFGYSGESIEDIGLTISMLDELQPYDLGISVSYPLPGTRFFEKVRADLGDKHNWKDSDDLDLMFHNTYSPEFYKILQRFVHYRFRTGQAAREIRNRQINRRSVLGPYYYTRQALLKKRLKTLEPDAAGLF